MTRRALIFDLDGTLTDPREGIVASIRHALAALDGVPAPPHDLDWAVGPPLHAIFTRLLGPGGAARVPEAVALYRARYREVGLAGNRVYPGVPACLAALHGRAALFVATVKPTDVARSVLAHFALAGFFRGVYGSDPAGTNGDKAATLARLLRREALAPGDAAMIGDRGQDVTAARANGIAGYGVAWGYGSRAELQDAGAAAIFADPAEVTGYFGAGG